MNRRPATVRSILVTGASSGIGKAIAEEFARAGWQAFGTSRRAQPGRPGLSMVQLDVRFPEPVAACVAQVLDRAGRIDVLVNNAGVMRNGVAEETILDEARGVFDTNLFGVVRMTNAVLPHLRRTPARADREHRFGGPQRPAPCWSSRACAGSR